jgi:tight adherence protein B
MSLLLRLPGFGDQRTRAERLAALRPGLARQTESRRDGKSGDQGAQLGAKARALIDPVLGINRNLASDERLPAVRPLVTGALAGAGAWVCLTMLLEVPAAFSAALAAAAALLVARATVAGARTKVLELMEEQFTLGLGVIIRCVRAGLPVTEGMRALASEVPWPTGPEFRRAVDQVQLGESFDSALQALADRCSLPDYRFFAVSVTLQRQTGGNLTETLENLSDTIRKRRAVRLKARALTSETRATVLVLALLPVAVGAVLMVVNPPYVMQLFITPSGRRLLGIAILVQMIGLAIIRSLSRRALA